MGLRMGLVETFEVCKVYRPASRLEVRAVDGVSLDIAEGSFTLLTGPSGSGKTTLLSLIGGMERPSSGRVVWAGRDLSDCSDTELTRVRRRIGFVFQDFALIAGLPVWENMTYPLIPRNVARAERLRLASDWLERVGLADKLWALPRELSGGEMQRIAIGRALAGAPELVLADEPTSNLDDPSARLVIELLEEVHAGGKTLIVSSHDPRIQALAGLVVHLEAGRVKEISANGTN
jgi:putative ABC transport system ATP-binding protein